MGVFTKLSLLGIAILGVLVASIYVKLSAVPPLPVLEEKWWGPGSAQKQDTAITPFKIDISDQVSEPILSMKTQLKVTKR